MLPYLIITITRALPYASMLFLLMFLSLCLSLIFYCQHFSFFNIFILGFYSCFFLNYLENEFLDSRVYWKPPLYLSKIGVRSAYIHPPKTHLWESTGYVLVLYLLISFQNDAYFLKMIYLVSMSFTCVLNIHSSKYHRR